MKIELNESERELTQQLADLYTSLETYTEMMIIQQKNIKSAQRDLKLSSERYAVGASTTLDQMDAQASLLESQSSLLKIQYSRKIVEAEVKQLLGY